MVVVQLNKKYYKCLLIGLVNEDSHMTTSYLLSSMGSSG